MTSKISSKNWVVFKAALKRLKWFGILYGIALFLELPLLLWMGLGKQKALQGDLWVEVANKTWIPQMLFHPVEHFVNIAVPVIFGLIIFNYLQKDRASTFFHSLPIKRGFLYCQNLLAGLTLIWLPILINGLLVYGVFSAFGVTEGQWHTTAYSYSYGMEMINNDTLNIVPIWQVVVYWLFLSLLMTGLFYIFTVFVGMLTGNVLLQGALTFIGLVLPLGVYMLIKYNLWKLLYGFPRDINSRTIEWLSPLVSYLNDPNYQFLFKSWTWYIWYLVAAVVLCGASIYLYKARHAEAAGETLAAEWIRWIFKYGVAVCGALTGGLYFSSVYENSTGVLYFGYFIGGTLGYVIADMVAYKSFHFYQRWKGMLVFTAVFVLLISSVKLDFYGYESYVPQQDQVKEVFLSNFNREGPANEQGLTGEENIRMVRLLHQEIVKLKQENRSQEDLSRKRQMESTARPQDFTSRIMSIDITYVLDSGHKVKRSYIIDIFRYRKFLYPIFQSEEAKRIMYKSLFKLAEDKIDQMNVNNYHLGRSVRIYKTQEISEALTALRNDVLNTTYEAAMEGKVPSKASIEFVSKADENKNYNSYNLDYYAEYKNFKEFLVNHGYVEDLFLQPEDVSAIIIKKVGTEDSVEIKDQASIEELLDWCSIEDERVYTLRQQQTEYKDSVEYYGKIVVESGNPIYVRFDSGLYAGTVISNMLNAK